MSPFGGARHDEFGLIRAALGRIEGNQEKMMATQQEQQDAVDSAVSAIQAVTADLTAQVQVIAAKLGSPVDTTALGAAVSGLQQAQARVDALAQPGAGTAGTAAPPAA